jgi:hypothetical protein
MDSGIQKQILIAIRNGNKRQVFIITVASNPIFPKPKKYPFATNTICFDAVLISFTKMLVFFLAKIITTNTKAIYVTTKTIYLPTNH